MDVSKYLAQYNVLPFSESYENTQRKSTGQPGLVDDDFHWSSSYFCSSLTTGLVLHASLQVETYILFLPLQVQNLKEQ